MENATKFEIVHNRREVKIFGLIYRVVIQKWFKRLPRKAFLLRRSKILPRQGTFTPFSKYFYVVKITGSNLMIKWLV